jgi:hypothetical protein
VSGQEESASVMSKFEKRIVEYTPLNHPLTGKWLYVEVQSKRTGYLSVMLVEDAQPYKKGDKISLKAREVKLI